MARLNEQDEKDLESVSGGGEVVTFAYDDLNGLDEKLENMISECVGHGYNGMEFWLKRKLQAELRGLDSANIRVEIGGLGNTCTTVNVSALKK